MKKINKITLRNLVAITSIFFLSSSCDNWIDHELNIDPDAPADVPMNLLLPGIEQSMGYVLMGNTSVRTSNIWMQLFDGTSRQAFTEARYQLVAADTENHWGSTYTDILENSQILMAKAQEIGQESPNFQGVAEVCTALTIGITSDYFGDMPYTEAFKGAENLQPTYDSHESVYNALFTLLDDAVVNLSATENVNPIAGDIIYEGDAGKWIKAAHSIKARHELQLSELNGDAAYTAALAALAAGGFTSNSDDMLVPFEEANKNPIFQFMEQRGDIRMGSTLIDLLTANDDPRLPFYAEEDATGNYTGSAPGSQNEAASNPGPNVAEGTAPAKIITYSEVKFIEAEAKFALGQAGAQEAYEAAVAASVLRITGEENTEWLDANVNGQPVSLENIISQKYIDGLGSNQPYADYRRTGLPALATVPGAVQAAVPSRFPYPQSELNYNSGNVPSASITDKVWWDK